jgi:hypothetical protein
MRRLIVGLMLLAAAGCQHARTAVTVSFIEGPYNVSIMVIK